jgi:hypothetical protein
MRKLLIPIPNLSDTEKTYLDADYSTGLALTVLNNYGFANDDFVIVGEPGEEKTETKDVTGQTGNTQIDISANLKFPHNKGCIVYRYEYDQYEIYRYRSSVWTLISTSNIQWDKRETIYIDANGLSTDSYKYRLKNSAATTYSDYSPTIAATGFTKAQVGYMINHVREVLGDKDRQIIKSDDEIIRQFNRAQEIIAGIRQDWWFLRNENSSITTTANTRRYGLASITDLGYIDTVRYRFNDGTTDITYHLEKKSMVEMDYIVSDNNLTSDDYPSAYTIEPPDNTDSVGYIGIDVPSKTLGYGTFYIRYYKTMIDLEDVSDSTIVPLPSILEDYALAYCFPIKGDETRGKLYMDRFYGPQPSKMEGQYNREPTGIRLLELMQKNKGKAVGQPRSLKVFRGRNPVNRYFKGGTMDHDWIVENRF